MSGRDPHERHRTATPLELFFDLCFVVAVAQAAAALHHDLADAHLADGIFSYLVVFFAIWWPWMNFTWFASAFDTDDIAYRLLTFVQMAGVLVVTAGIPGAFERFDWSVMVVGYVIMRIALVGQWLRAAHDDPERRPTALRFAVGVGLVQLGWAIRLAIGPPWGFIAFAVLGVAELAIPVWAERSGPSTPWHAGHIAERYGLFTIIVLGECILAATMATQAAFAASGFSAEILAVAIGGLLLVFGLWWAYFKHHTSVEALRSSWRSFAWGYGQYVVFAAVAALGAGLQVAAEATYEEVAVDAVTSALAVAVPAGVYLVALFFVHGRNDTSPTLVLVGSAVGAMLAIALFAGGIGVPAAVLAMGLVVVALIATNRVIAGRLASAGEARESDGARSRAAADGAVERAP
jgi:low temperature requirement protein LtrA